MRILFLTQVLPYPVDAGPKIRAYYVLRHLAERGHEVELVSFVRESDTKAAVNHLASFCRAVHTVPMRRSKGADAAFLLSSLLTGHSFIIRRDTQPAMQSLVGKLSNGGSFDAVHADQLWMAQYALRCRGLKWVLDQHNAVHLIPRRLAAHEGNPFKRLVMTREARVLARYEADVCRRVDRLVTVTEEDHRTLASLYGHNDKSGAVAETAGHASVIPICVDPDQKPLAARRPDARRILILGTMFWPPNVEGALWFGRQVLPRVIREVPDAMFTLIGKNPPPEIQRMAESADSHVEVLGYVDDLMPFLEQTAVFVVPLRSGGGMRVKILDAWCWGLPMVSTTIGAEGISVRHGENILIADGEDAFARAVVEVMCQPGLAQRMRDSGRRWVEQTYNWRVVYPRWDQVYEGLHG